MDTAVVHVVHGDHHLPARAALDSGSGVSPISESFASQLKLPRYPHRVVVEGAYGGGSRKHYVQARLQSLSKPEQFVTLKFTVIPKLKKSKPPHSKEAILAEPAIRNLQLADRDLGGPLDLIISSIDCCKCITKDFIYYPEVQIAATKTIFGWTITGPLKNGKSTTAPLLQTQPKEDNLYKSLEPTLGTRPSPGLLNSHSRRNSCGATLPNTHQIQADGRYPEFSILQISVNKESELSNALDRTINHSNENTRSKTSMQYSKNTWILIMRSQCHQKPRIHFQSTICQSTGCSKSLQQQQKYEQYLMPPPSLQMVLH